MKLAYMKKRRTTALIMGLLMVAAVSAQEEPKLVVKPTGRILFDAAYIRPQHIEDKLNSGVGIPDMRIGVGFSYDQWKGKVEMGFAYGKLSMKDVWVQYDFDKKNFIRGGYFRHKYGYQSSTSTSFKESMEEPQTNTALNNERLIGLMYEYNSRNFLATASIVVETDAKTMYKFTPEIMYANSRFAVIGQYYLNTITRDNNQASFTGSGAYITLRALVKGHEYSSNLVDGGIAIPDPGNMELCLQYNYTSLSDATAGIYGGYLNDWSLCYNYYFNKYMIWRVRASWTKVTNRIGFLDNECGILETRLQVKF